MNESLPPIIRLVTIDSTNNYAMNLINGNKAYHGMTITAQNQTKGKGQRGKVWENVANESLLMSIIVVPEYKLEHQFVFNAMIVTSIVQCIRNITCRSNIYIKWPNDIIMNDKKAGGILIENVLRGSIWQYSVVGLGLNVLQTEFSKNLPYATSLKMTTGAEWDIDILGAAIRESVLSGLEFVFSLKETMELYNSMLYKRSSKQMFLKGESQFEAQIIEAKIDGTLTLQFDDGQQLFLQHGQALWDYESNRK